MSFHEDEYLMISGIQHFSFCRRQWALIHIEQLWEENVRTVDGMLMHKHAHDQSSTEKRLKKIITRGMPVYSARLGVSGECDVVEFHESEKGIKIHGWDKLYDVIPVEYKRGQSKSNDSDRLQLVTQALCMEEMLCCDIEKGYLYYGETKRREEVVFDSALRTTATNMISEMHKYYSRKYTPKAKRTRSCNACSLKNLCLPELEKATKASYYLKKHFLEVEDETTP